MIIAASLPTMLAQSYTLNTFKIGLGALAASITQRYVLDWNFRRHAARADLSIRCGRQRDLRDFLLERASCEVALPNHVVGMLGMVVFWWLMEYRMSLAGPEVVLFVLGFSVNGCIQRGQYIYSGFASGVACYGHCGRKFDQVLG
jgi:hypothetical protein